ncbi:hypothetical protein [Streptomyces sp. NPDC059009]|uniref:hypothetical protein n=1 Tax=Streptomyces sp. NPDC059009 TaxID=3346694 RepID=UPI0036D0BD31
MRQPTNHPALRALDPLVGRWRMYAVPGGGPRVGPVLAEWAWTDDGGFLVQRADLAPDVEMPQEWRDHHPFPTVTITGYDETEERFTMLHADARGVSRVYGLGFAEGELRIWRAAPGFHQRFAARFDAGGDTLTGAWELSKDGVTWAEDFGVVYERAPA